MRTEDQLTKELNALGQQWGAESERKTRRMLAAVVRWQREHGHGTVMMSAKDHDFSSKVRIDSVIDVDGTVK